jgi:hypothetical protein
MVRVLNPSNFSTIERMSLLATSLESARMKSVQESGAKP